MNDPNKKIEIDKSSLLSLKAELLRKQEEVSRAKTSTSIDDFVPKRVPKAPESHPPSSGKSKSKSSKSSASGSDGKTDKKPIELEDSAQLDRSKKVLIAKSKYYDRMMASGGSLNSDENCLVMFNQKKQTERPTGTSYRYSSGEESEPSSSSSDEEDGRGAKNRLPERDDDLVEYTDYLGRSRKCLRKELDEMLRVNREMEREARASRGEEPSSNAAGRPAGPAASLRDDNSEDDGEELIGPPVPSVAITEDNIGERFREMREQWTKQEAANLEKDSVHYSDVLFDEARQHGVGYYAFSTDRDERNRQQLELDAIREATVDAQREKEDLRAARDRIIADRVRAAKARQRARLGLPPEEEEEQKEKKVAARDELYDTEEERKRAKAEAKAKKKREKEERRRDRERSGHVRPWDEGKEQDLDSRDWKPAKEWRVMSQEEWNEAQRKERNSEFAPPVDYGRPASRWERNPLLATQNKPRVEDEEDESDEKEQIGPLPPSQGYEQGMDNNPLLMPPPMTTTEEISMPSIPGLEDICLPEEAPTRALFFTTKRKEFKRRNYESTAETAEKRPNLEQHRVPIRNELSEDKEQEEDEDQRGRGGVEIAPPPTFDYYGPTTVRSKGGKLPRKPPPVSKGALEASIEAGLKFLRNQSDKAGPSGGTKNRWTSNADY
uniref:CCDC174 alpha/beta GRSR domain-containing protein n=1 Tax=Culex tarsalis TaxID=7177 RepID=A0A1Q3FUV4_CULTA